jgi:hypothetical protein
VSRVRENRMHGSTGGGRKRNANNVTAPAPDPTKLPAAAETSRSPSATNPPTRCRPVTPPPRPSPSPRTCCTWPTSKSCTAKTSPSPKNSTGCSASARSPKTWSPVGRCKAKAGRCGASGSSCTRCKPCSTPPNKPSPTPTTPSKPSPDQPCHEETRAAGRIPAGDADAGAAPHRADRRGSSPRPWSAPSTVIRRQR